VKLKNKGVKMLKINLLLLLVIFTASSLTVFSQTENWRQYSSTMAGFAVKYPSDWQVEQEEAKGQIWRITINSPGQRDDDVWEHNSITICSKPKSDSFENLDRCAEHHLGIKNNKLVSEKTIILKEIEIRKIETTDVYHQNTIFLIALFSTKDRDFQISGVFRKIFNLDRFIPVFDQMLETFRPLKEKSVLTYKNEQFDFALTYPTSWKSCPITGVSNKDEEEMLILVPEGRLCNGGNYISVSRMTKFSYEKNNRDLKEFLKDKVFSKTVPYIEFGNIHAALGEKIDDKYIYRERYFYTNYPQTYELLKISEMYELNNGIFQKESKEILTTARRFLRFQ
jgi:hypothetical protein